MNVKNCCVDSCSSSSIREQDKGVTFHRLPKNILLRSKWMRQARINIDDNKNKWKFICSRHFRKIDFEPYKSSKFALKLDAIPTIFPWGITPLEDLEKIFSSEGSFNAQRSRLSSDTEVKSDSETKSVASKDSEDSEQPAKKEFSLEESEEMDETRDEDEGEEVKDNITITEQFSSTAKNTKNDEIDSLENYKSGEAVHQPDLIKAPMKKKRGRKSKNEILLAKLAAKAKRIQQQAMRDKETGRKEENVTSAEKRVRMVRNKNGNKTPSKSINEETGSDKKEMQTTQANVSALKTKSKKISLSNNDKKIVKNEVEMISSEDINKASEKSKSPLKIVSDEIKFTLQEFSKSAEEDNLLFNLPSTEESTSSNELPSTSIRLEKLSSVKMEDFDPSSSITDMKELGALKKIEKSNYSPMLKALIEKKTPMTKPKPKMPTTSFSSGSGFESPKYSIASPGSEKSMMVPGARVEAKDFSEQWYAARIMEVDHDEMEVLIHYDNWSQRYDEWISMSSPRLRVLGPPVGPPPPPGPPIYSEGERCLARWSDNRRFPATVQKVLPDDKYEVVFDDGFVRALKWGLLSKAQATDAISPSTAPCASPSTPLTPVPYGARKSAPALPAAPTSPLPPPVHNHLFDPSRDHLGSKEERRDMKRKLNVKELFSGKKKSRLVNDTVKMRKMKKFKLNVDRRLKGFRDMKALEQKLKAERDQCTEESMDMGEAPESLPTEETEDVSLLLKDEWSCHWRDGQPIGEVVTPSQAERDKSKSGPGGEPGDGPRLERMSVRVTDHRLPPGWTKYLIRRCLGHSAGKWDVVLVCPMGRRYRSRVEMRTRLSEPDASELAPYAHCLQDFSVHRKLARRLGWDHSGSGSPWADRRNRVDSPSLKERVRSPALKVKKEPLRVGSPALKVKKQSLRVGSPVLKVKKEHVRVTSPALKIKTEQDRVESPTSKTGREFSGIESPVLKMDRAASPALKVKLENVQIKMESTQVNLKETDELEDVPELMIPTTLLTPEPPQPTSFPPLEDGFIYVGSLKVQVIDNLLRCPKEGCFKNFRKDNFLQMHIKHYHSELCSFLGDTPNVADLAYARTIVEDVPAAKPVEKTHKIKERRSTTAMLIPNTELDMSLIKKEVSSQPMDEVLINEPTTPSKITNSLEVMDRSPKLRTLLEGKPDMKQEPGISKVKKESSQDVEDFMTVFKIKNDSLKVKPSDSRLHPKTEGSKSSRSIKIKLEKDISKSRVKSIISKIAREEGNRSRSQSPNTDQLLATSLNLEQDVLEVGTEESAVPRLEMNIFPTPHKSKKKSKKRHFLGDSDFHPSKKKKSKPIDVWSAFTDEHDETRSSFGTPDMMVGAHATVNTPLTADISVCRPKMEAKEESNQSTFVTDTGEKIKIVHMKREEIINCHCGFGEEDGLMIQCELCLCWQHAICHNIEKESEVPEKYVCRICLHPARGRRSQRHLNSQDWLYEGRLPRAVPPVSAHEAEADQRRAAALRRSHQLAGNLLHASRLLHALRCKIEVSQKKDHPKLYLWSKPWDGDSPAISDGYNHSKFDQNSKDAIKREDSKSQNPRETPYPEEHYDDITIDQVKLEVGESVEVSEVNDIDEDMDDGVPKCDNEIELSTSEPQLSADSQDEIKSANMLTNLLASPGGTPLHLTMTNSDLETFKTVQVSAPQPEAAIDPAECRLRLLQHVERTQALLDARLDSIEAQIAELESQDPSLADDETPEYYPRTKQTVQMLLRDLTTMEELGMIS